MFCSGVKFCDGSSVFFDSEGIISVLSILDFTLIAGFLASHIMAATTNIKPKIIPVFKSFGIFNHFLVLVPISSIGAAMATEE